MEWDAADETDRLATLLDYLTGLESSDFARNKPRDKQWRLRARAALMGHSPAPLDQQKQDLAADMRELIRAALKEPKIIDSEWFWRRAHRALCQEQGTVAAGKDFVREYRAKVDGRWTGWRLLTPDTWSKRPSAETQVRFAPGVPFDAWEQPAQSPQSEPVRHNYVRREEAP